MLALAGLFILYAFLASQSLDLKWDIGFALPSSCIELDGRRGRKAPLGDIPMDRSFCRAALLQFCSRYFQLCTVTIR
jgi:hypothetical protein